MTVAWAPEDGVDDVTLNVINTLLEFIDPPFWKKWKPLWKKWKLVWRKWKPLFYFSVKCVIGAGVTSLFASRLLLSPHGV